MSALDEYLAALDALPEEKKRQVIKDAQAATAHLRWVPNPGPQTKAYFSEADELLFGGEAGGGKSDLGIGLSLTAHQRSLVLRRTNKEAEKLFDRYETILGTTAGKNSQKGWRVDGRIIDIGGCQLEADKQKRKGIAHDLKFFDELVDFTESQYTFIITWTRSTHEGQRTRIVATTNPPTSPAGMWVVKRWAAWLDPAHPNPAKDGELRWYTAGEDGQEIEVDGKGPHEINGKEVYAKSRTFIRSKLNDNPDLTRTGDYQAQLNALPAELRAAYAEGRFDAQLKDQPFQIIPTEWIRSAQDAWEDRPPAGIPQCAIGVDVTGGGTDPMKMAIRHDGWYAPIVTVEAAKIDKMRPGASAAGHILSHRRDNSTVVVDMGGGYGGPTYEKLHENQIAAVPFKGAEGSVRRTKDGLLKFTNVRTQAYWQFREALDPSQPGGSPIRLPPDPAVLAQLVAVTFSVTPNGIKAEPKEDVQKKLGRSPDDADAVVMAWYAGPTYVTDGRIWQEDNVGKLGGRKPQVIMSGRRSPLTGPK
jgi:hypothetical protein